MVSDISAVVAQFLGLRLWAGVKVLANFVLDHPACNRSKSNTLAAKQHLHKWLDFVQTNVDNLSQIGYDSGIWLIKAPCVQWLAGAMGVLYRAARRLGSDQRSMNLLMSVT